jgi:hypothetical protein
MISAEDSATLFSRCGQDYHNNSVSQMYQVPP